MYEQYWGLNEKPFTNNVDSRFTFVSQEYDEALSRLRYADSQNYALVLLTGEIGCGKTFLLHNFATLLRESGHSAAVLVNPMYDATEILQAIARQFGLDDTGPGKVDVLESLVDFARENYEQKAKTCLLIDEAQTVSSTVVWEEIRMLLNHEEGGLPLFRIVMAGTPNFIEKIKDVPALWQRIELKCALGGLAEGEVAGYLEHRLKVAGGEKNVFTDEACATLFDLTGGNPREANVLADLALLSACGAEAEAVDAEHIKSAGDERASVEVTETLKRYIGNTVSNTVHLSHCIALPDKKSQAPFDSLQEALDAGFDPCDLCINA